MRGRLFGACKTSREVFICWLLCLIMIDPDVGQWQNIRPSEGPGQPVALQLAECSNSALRAWICIDLVKRSSVHA